MTATDPRRLDFIDALRGFAILMVIAVHASQRIDDLPWQANALAEQGSRGVQLFFLVSALTLCLSWSQRRDGLLPFYLRRLFRIAPMYWLAIAFFVALQGLGPNSYAADGLHARHLIMAASFTHGLAPDTINSVVPGSWSIADEVAFYAIFPALFALFDRLRLRDCLIAAIVIVMICSVATTLLGSYVSMLPAAEQPVWSVYRFLWFPQQLPAFLMGMAVFKVADSGLRLGPKTAASSLAGSVALFVAVAFAPDRVVDLLGLVTWYAIAFALAALALMNSSPRAIVNPATVWIGKVSYSAYFIHFALLGLLPATLRLTGFPVFDWLILFFALAAASIGMSCVTYRVVELPAIAAGRHLIASLEKRRAITAAP